MIFVSGSIAYDSIMDFPGKFSDHILPEKLHAINVSFLVPEMHRSFGGTAGNIAYTLGLLGAPVMLLGCVGKDFPSFGEHLAAAGVDCSRLVHDETRYCSTAMGITDAGDNQIWGFYPGADEVSDQLSIPLIESHSEPVCAGRRSEESRRNHRSQTGSFSAGSADQDDNPFAIIAPHNPKTMMKFAREYTKKNIPYLFDPGMQLRWLSGDDLKTAFTGARVIIGNDYEVAVMEKATGIANLHSLATGYVVVITTLGEVGSKITKNGKTITISAAKVSKAIDPSGAGDAYRSGFTAGYIHDFSLQTCGQMGSLAAAYAVETYGTTNHTFTKEEFKKRYQENFGEEITL